MMLPGIMIEAIKMLPYRFLLKAVLRAVEGMSIIEALDQAFEEYIHYEETLEEDIRRKL